MAQTSLYDDLKKALQDFKTFLDTNLPTIQPAIRALKSIVPQITELIDKLIGLMQKLKTEINNLNVSAIPGLSQVAAFTAGIKALLEVAKKLLPDVASDIDSVLSTADVVSGLPSLDQVKADILTLIDQIIGELNTLKS